MIRLIVWSVIIGTSFYVSAESIQPPRSNLSADYPAHACGDRVPLPPVRPKLFKIEAALVDYNAKVEEYNQTVERLVNCIQNYVDNAASDIEHINALSKKAITFLTEAER